MRARVFLKLISLAVLMTLTLAPAASAYNDGRGFYGATNDKAVTDTGFILVVAIPLLVFCMSMLQRSLDKRKQARKAAQKSYASNPRWRGGW